MGCSLSTETKRVALDPKKLKRTPSGNHYIFEVPVEDLQMPGEKEHHNKVSTPTPQYDEAMDDSAEKLLDAALEAQEKVLYYLSAEGKAEFDPNGKSGEVTMMVRSQTSETLQIVMGYRSFGVDEIDMQRLLDVLMDPEARKDFDKQTADGKMLKKALIDEPDRRLDLHYDAFKGMMNVGGRDAVFAVLRQKINNNLWIVSSKSVDLPEYPENGVLSGYVRCDVKFAGYAMSIDPDTEELTVTMYNQVDVKGNIPTWIVNKAQNKQPACLNDLYKLVRKD
ncbi:Phosphatidylcholine transfer protein, putative [Perkinsus marinus ATCC 50983]|uniref:Phosphatidylcholine transfer protein, putative n=1 Tax=Perkinsus marinus (strain ATCC 50983 / TXsc) TaxID=423536 RepID=C5K9C5_PERM5|nr:Phosphatidylcholine transfer protein, putative [Perkinsus marinus ATCC 50983]EER18913.1 Phosphatidylcholine transfer protein, putative [Perkinsus marinus ATCC 50983]|eukprot:XP_002787117.1 Phosphatidylcholine transfer protein, putative [Perkinsus marinus ATCC 50983]